MRWWLAVLVCGCGRIGFPETGTIDSSTGDSRLADGRAHDGPSVSADGPSTTASAYAYWKFDELTGTIATDQIGNQHPMTMVNGPVWGPGQVGGAVTADGVNDFGRVPSLDFTATTSKAVTVAFWVNRVYSAGPRHTLLELSGDFNTVMTGFGIFPDDTTTCFAGQIMVGLQGDVGYNMSCFAQPTSGAWHHLVAVFDKSRPANNEVTLYIDGTEQTPVAVPNVSDNTNGFGALPLYLFSRAGTMEQNAGTVDDLIIWTRALTPLEISQL
ncbi:MAG: abfA [Myxococcales bacterium]|nr:abfA [Myxococcales bacterium]